MAFDRARGFVSMSCSRCLPPWEANDVQLDQPSRSTAPIDIATERQRRPGCGGQVLVSSTKPTAAKRLSEAS